MNALPSGMQMMLKSLGIDPQKAMDNVTALQQTGSAIIEALQRLDTNITEFRAEQARLTALLERSLERDDNERSEPHQHIEQSAAAAEPEPEPASGSAGDGNEQKQ